MHTRVAVKALNNASTVLKNEVAAGHFIYKDTAHINFSCANFGYQNVAYDDEKLFTWHDGLWNAIVDGTTVDIDGDGKVDAPSCLGYVPLWPSRAGDGGFNEDAPIIYYRAANKEYPHVFIASDAHRYWLNDADVAKNFPEITYKTHDGKKISQPKTLKEIDADGVHLAQLGYNAQGQDIARNLYSYLKGGVEVKDVTVYNITTNTQGTKVSGSISAAKGKTYKLSIVCDPVPVSDLEITVSDNLELTSPFHVTAKESGDGVLTIKQGDKVIKTITFKVK
jgi:hypothetical protein